MEQNFGGVLESKVQCTGSYLWPVVPTRSMVFVTEERRKCLTAVDKGVDF